MTGLIIGNLCSLLAMITDSVSSSRQSAREVLLFQCVGQAIYGLGAIALKGYSAAVQNAVSILRNLFAIKEDHSKYIEWLLIAAGVILGLLFNNRGIFGWLPIIGNLEYSVAVFRFKDNEWALKAAFLVNVLFFAVFNIVVLNIVGVVANIVIIITTAIFLIKEKNTERK